MSIYEKLGAKTAGIKARSIEKPTEKLPKTGPGIHFDATTRMHAAEERVEELEALLKNVESGTAISISLDELHEVTGRKRKLSGEEYEELKNNLIHNELVTPITVRIRTEGGYEIISGHNRTQVYRDLNRKNIPAIIQATDNIQADLNAFYANLLHPSLPDYQKYLGFKMIQKRQPEQSLDEIARMTGKSKRHIEQLMKFASLPQAVHDILNTNQVDLGSNAVEEFVKLIEKGKSEKVVEAIKKLAIGELNQKQAVSYAALTHKNVTQNKKSETIRQGRSVYCTFRQAHKVLRLEFNSEEEAAAAQQIVKVALAKLAEERKNGT